MKPPQFHHFELLVFAIPVIALSFVLVLTVLQLDRELNAIYISYGIVRFHFILVYLQFVVSARPS